MGEHWNLSEEACANISKAQMGKKLSEKTKRKISLARRGIKRSEETKRKISDGHKKSNYKGRAADNYKRKRLQCLEYGGGKCQHCGKSPEEVQRMAFHHLDDNKEFNVLQSVYYLCYRLKAEMDKCILLCNSCHMRLHMLKRKEL